MQEDHGWCSVDTTQQPATRYLPFSIWPRFLGNLRRPGADSLELTKLPDNEIRMIGADGKTSSQIPLEAGYFEVLLPKILFESKPKSITISWIDFYR